MTYTPIPSETLDTNNSGINLTGDFVGVLTETNQYSNVLLSFIGSENSEIGGLLIKGYNTSNGSDTSINLHQDTYIANSKYSICIPITTKYYNVEITYPAGIQYSLLLFKCVVPISTNYISPYKSKIIRPIRSIIYVPNISLQIFNSRNPGPLHITTSVTSIASTISYVGNTINLASHINETATIQSKAWCSGSACLLFEATVILNTNSSSNTSTNSIGMLGTCGPGIQCIGNTLSLFYKLNSTSNIIQIPNSNWNGDKLNGSMSTYVYNSSIKTTFQIEISYPESYVKWYVVSMGELLCMHTLTLTETFETPYFPIKCSSVSSLTSAGNLTFYSASISTIESRLISTPFSYTASSLNTSIGIPASNTQYPLIYFKINSTLNYHQRIYFTGMSLLPNATTTYNLSFGIIPDGLQYYTTGSEPTYTSISGSALQYSAPTTLTSISTYITNGTIIPIYTTLVGTTGGYYADSSIIPLNVMANIFSKINGINSNINNVSDIFIVYIQVGGTPSIRFSLTWDEYI